MKLRALALLVSIVVVPALVPTPAHAERKRRVAVLEYRAGSRGVPDIATRMASLLAHTSVYDVLGPSDGRRKLGAGLDAEVARCTAEARCLAAIAQRLGADEVLLVGVSQLGDIVIALQRVEAKPAQAIARLAESLPPEDEPDEHAISDWLHQLYPVEAFSRYGELRITSEQDDAVVEIDGNKRGVTPLASPLKLPAPGTYRVRVEKPGYVAFQARIEVPPDSTMEVRATLSPVSTVVVVPWYKRAYVWGTVAGVVVAAAGVGVAIYFGTRSDTTPQFYLTPPK